MRYEWEETRPDGSIETWDVEFREYKEPKFHRYEEGGEFGKSGQVSDTRILRENLAAICRVDDACPFYISNLLQGGKMMRK